MTVCDRSTGRRLLGGDLPAGEETAFIRHLERCPQCRDWLEAEVGDVQTWQMAQQLLANSSEVLHWPSAPLVQDTEIQLPSASNTPAVTAPFDVTWLAPTDDPSFMGRIGSYEVSGVIGRGGMGLVFKARDPSLNRNVAIKVLDPSLASIGAARERFAREARAMAALSHEHVVPIYCVDHHQGLPYFAMEYVAGGTLESRIRAQGPLDTISTVRITLQVAMALSAAHESGLVHRDIKPANILLDPGIDRVRVADFGLARISSDASYTRSGVLAGTPQFMAPEQVRGEACDARSDLFSLGSVAYAMCTGHPPFRSESVYGVMQRIVHDSPRDIRDQAAEVPTWLAQFIGRLLHKDRDKRFASAAEVTQLLEAELSYLQGAGATAPSRDWVEDSPSHTKRARRIDKRVLVMIAALIGLGSGVTYWRGVPRENNTPPPPLWNHDEINQVKSQTARMEAELLWDSSMGSYDPWDEATFSIGRRLAELDAELSEHQVDSSVARDAMND